MMQTLHFSWQGGLSTFLISEFRKPSNKKNKKEQFPGGPVVRTLHFAEGIGSIPGWGLCSHKPRGQKNKIRKKKKNKNEAPDYTDEGGVMTRRRLPS